MKYSCSARLFWKPFKSIKEHLSAQQIYGYAVSAALTISLGTVYRNLNTLADNNMIGRVAWSAVPNVLTGTPTPMSIFTAASATRSLTLICRKASWTPDQNVPGLRIEATAWPWPRLRRMCQQRITLLAQSATVLPLQDQSSQLVIIFSSPLFPVFVGKSFFVPLALFCILFQLRYAGFMRQIFNFMNKKCK